nr:hypothetical protein [Prevotella aurantiaca]
MNALQHPLFCVVKEPILHYKSACFALQNRRFCNVKQQLPVFTCAFIYKKKKYDGSIIMVEHHS